MVYQTTIFLFQPVCFHFYVISKFFRTLLDPDKSISDIQVTIIVCYFYYIYLFLTLSFGHFAKFCFMNNGSWLFVCRDPQILRLKIFFVLQEFAKTSTQSSNYTVFQLDHETNEFLSTLSDLKDENGKDIQLR